MNELNIHQIKSILLSTPGMTMLKSLRNKLLHNVSILLLSAIITSSYYVPIILLNAVRLLPSPLLGMLDYVYFRSKWLQSIFSLHLAGGDDDDSNDNEDSNSDDDSMKMTTIQLLCSNSRLKVASHDAVTPDGFHLTLHRLSRYDSSTFTTGTTTAATMGENVNRQRPERKKMPVLIMHGLMQSSESMICSGTSSLAATLAHAGYDVYLGNNRGNKYSKKHDVYHTDDKRYWDFSLDELAAYDVPSMIKYICKECHTKQLVCIGFSQGSAQIFAALSNQTLLQESVKLFIALSPPVCAKGFSNPMISSLLLDATPASISFMFGNKSMFLSSVQMWQKVFSKKFYSSIVAKALHILFDCNLQCINQDRRIELFQYIFGDSSVKSVIQWLQMIKRMNISTYVEPNKQHDAYISYDISSIKCPIAYFAGACDKLIDLDRLKQRLPAAICSNIIPLYEHLDVIWADDCHEKVFKPILALLDKTM